MISDIDDDDNGYITFEEFVPLMGQVVHEDKYLEEELYELFIHFAEEKKMLTSDDLVDKLFIATNGELSEGKSYFYSFDSTFFVMLVKMIRYVVNKHYFS